MQIRVALKTGHGQGLPKSLDLEADCPPKSLDLEADCERWVLNLQDYARVNNYEFVLGIKQVDPQLENMWNKPGMTSWAASSLCHVAAVSTLHFL